MFGRGKKEKDIQKVLDQLTPDEKNDLLAILQGNNEVGEKASENSTTQEVEQNPTNPNDEKINEVAKTTDDINPVDNEQPQEMQEKAISVDDVMLKSDFENYIKQFEDKINGITKTNEQLKQEKEALAKENEELKAKYENTSFGNYTSKSTDGKVEEKKNETFSSYADQFFKK